MNYVVSLIHPVDELNRVTELRFGMLGFHEPSCGEGWGVVENGAQSIRLVSPDPTSPHFLPAFQDQVLREPMIAEKIDSEPVFIEDEAL